MKSKIKGWCQLLRLPNLFTVSGDCVLGYVIADGDIFSYKFFYSILSIFFLYSYGLITNDLCDISEDSKERPERPLPSGVVSKKEAQVIALLLLIFSLIFAFMVGLSVFYVAISLAFAITIYNYLLKKNSIFGPVSLGICRILSISLGFEAANGIDALRPILYIVAFIWFIYFFSISLVAYYETDLTRSPRGGFMLFTIPIMWLFTIPFISGSLYPVMIMKEINPTLFLALATTVIFSLFILKNGILITSAFHKKGVVPKSVGELIWSIIFLQASGCAFFGFPYLALILLISSIPARISAQKFYGS
jgi:4-hydroxybenzoate polyprenyltransferase